MSDAEIDVLAREFVDWYVVWNPVAGTQIGIHDRDSLLPSATYETELEERARVQEFLQRLEGIERKDLSPAKRVDHGVMRNSFRLWIFESEELGIWQAMPQAADGIGGGLFPLFMREFAPLPKRLESITNRLERSPAYIEESKSRIRDPVKIWSEIGLESAQRFPGFLQTIVAAGKGVLAGPDLARLEEGTAKTNESLGAYANWIEHDVLPRSMVRVGVGAAKFRKLVRLRELGMTVEEIYAVGKKYLRDSKRELARVAGEIQRGASVEEAKEIVKSDHPARFEEALKYTATVMQEAKAFIVEHDLATIPPNEQLTVIETPNYIRHVIPFAAYNAPARFEAHKQGFYMVTPVEDKPEMLREHSYPGTRNTAVHEGYPGHHLQLTCASLNRSYARILASATETIEGWAHYCEDMMKAAGFSADPKTKFVQLLDQIWRACRILIDIDLHTGRMTFDEGVDLLVREAGMERPGAIAEVKRYTYWPAYQLSYLLGKHLILGLRKDVKKDLGKGYSDKFFHDTILYAGSLPMKYMREIFAYEGKSCDGCGRPESRTGATAYRAAQGSPRYLDIRRPASRATESENG
ncbi:MAG TPA: DUF885 domain-containing protein [Thermoplasmata archaeon]|nr:DUF885 domain-containing protein [Thermoplasmata archaeon]